jgi:hypothetical protein
MTAENTLHQAHYLPTDGLSSQQINVEMISAERASGPTVRLKVGTTGQQEIILSIEQARALSLAIISAVNKQEQHTHARHKQGRLATVSGQPTER